MAPLPQIPGLTGAPTSSAPQQSTVDQLPIVTLEEIGIVLRKFRQIRRLNQVHVAHDAEIAVSHLSDIERGVKGVGVGLLARLLPALGVTWQEFGRVLDVRVARRAAQAHERRPPSR